MSKKKRPGRGVKTAETVFGVIESVQHLGGASVSEIADHMDLARSTVHNHVKTLAGMDYLIEAGGKYHLGLKFLDHGYHAAQRLPVSDIKSSTLDTLAQKTGEVAWIVVEEHGKAINLTMATGDSAVRTADRVGLRTHLHFHAAGKAILSGLSDDRVDEILSRHGLPAATENTITDRETLEEELEEIRDRGYALNDGEAVESLRSVASPVDLEGEALTAVSVMGPEQRLHGDRFYESIPEAVKGAANALELELKHS
jgi:DNA-binding IclR family transcriptional regulator